MILAYEDFGDKSSTSAVLEALDGLWVLADATGDTRYAEWANAAAEWEARNSYLGDGLFRDQFDVKTGRYLPAAPGARPGRPLNDDAIFLKAAQRARKPDLRTCFSKSLNACCATKIRREIGSTTGRAMPPQE